jgi:hypothetical protein
MKRTGSHLQDIFRTPAEHGWCDTTRLASQMADPWSILLGRTMRPPRRTADGCDLNTPERDDPDRTRDWIPGRR